MNRKILIVDDEAGVLDAYRIILNPQPASLALASSRGGAAPKLAQAPDEVFECTYVDNGPAAVAAVEQSVQQGAPFAGGFFDVKLGGNMDGIDVIKRVKDLDPNFLCVMVTAYQDRSVDEIANVFGRDFADRWDFLSKPFSRNEILQKVRNIVANWDRKKREREYLQQITEQQQQLIQSESLAAIGKLARGIGHEFGNILLGISGRAELALQKKTPEAMEEALHIVAKSAERAGVITRNLQTLAKVETQREMSDVRDVISESTVLMEHELRKSGIRLMEDFNPPLPMVRINRVEVGQVFLNLAINAVHAMKEKGEGGTLAITAKNVDQGVEILVQDTGCGIEKENLDKIFNTLFTTKGSAGSGIGLSVAKKIITNHGGTIAVASEVGRGTTFRVWLPKGDP